MTKTDAIINAIIKREGGYVDHPADRGGPTKHGITLKTLRSFRRAKTLTAADVKRLTKAEAFKILFRRYVVKPKLQLMPDPIRADVIDASVLGGPSSSIKMLQRALIENGSSIAVDGAYGSSTNVAVLKSRSKPLCRLFALERISRFRRIVDRKSSQRTFFLGWVRRALDVCEEE